MTDEFKATLWQLAESWPCDYALIEKPPKNGKKAPTSISIHLDKCRKCDLKKHLLLFDEKLKHVAEMKTDDPAKKLGWVDCAEADSAADSMKEHAQFVRDEMIGAPKG